MSDILCWAALAPIIGMAISLLTSAGRRSRLLLAEPSPDRPAALPDARETALSVQRFREASDRFIMLDLAWERYSHGRGLLTEDMARALRRRPSRKKASPERPARIPKWL